ncbi:hypothetical protein C7B82_09535 [Stenomitos frigidus ULC18]|uniref:Uncharacterized protein n=1 Tax=Stenomitos frigidus ULC18 TaxID=2107698 RepID=A0A2T1EBW2_9CYAN|nr:hypothetical protein C7B82_09535 [Stenomitos frigidus ULC18]
MKITLYADLDRISLLADARYYKRLNFSRVINREHTTDRQVSFEDCRFFVGETDHRWQGYP